jgi:hypothetical protein
MLVAKTFLSALLAASVEASLQIVPGMLKYDDESRLEVAGNETLIL